MTRKLLSMVAVALLVATLAADPGAAKKNPKKPAPLAFGLSTVGPKVGPDGELFDGEPLIHVTKDRWFYVSYPGNAGMVFYSSRNGRTWTRGGLANNASGDTTVHADASGAVYQTNLNSGGTDPLSTLQGDVYKSFDHGRTWPQKGTINEVFQNSSASPLFVDRQWSDAYIPPGLTTDQARVYLTYHDFVASQMWVNVSKDGGRTFAPPVDAIGPEANLDSFCDTIPGGLQVVKSGPRAGRVYLLWITGDAPTNAATGCNATQLQSFHSVWMAWSDDEGASWTNKRLVDAGQGHDASALFADLTLDRLGNPVVAFSMNLADVTAYNVHVIASYDGGTTWVGGTDTSLVADGAVPLRVNETDGTHVFPAVVSGDPGKVAIAYLRTPSQVPTLPAPSNKFAPGGDPDAMWDVYVAQTMNLRAPQPKWTTVKVTRQPMHIGDICTLGIFCSVFEPVGANRDLLDFIDVAIDPSGKAYVAYTDDNDRQCICVAYQTAGPDLIASR